MSAPDSPHHRVLENDVARVVVDLEHGGRLASLRVFGRELLVGPPEDPGAADQLIHWGCYPMAPYAGRVRSAGYGGVCETRGPRPHLCGFIYDCLIEKQATYADVGATSSV